jgi:hypothetical protein
VIVMIFDMRRDGSALVHHVYHDGVKPCIVRHDTGASIHDPIFRIDRNRVVAETLKAVLRLNLEQDTALVEEMLRFLLSRQHPDGSWSEIHPYYDQHSALITSIVGEAFLVALRQQLLSDELTAAVNHAKEYVLKNEKRPGYYLKSTSYTADHLNVDATCGAFLSDYASHFHDEESLQAAKRASDHIIDYQWSNGVYPYAIDKGTYDYVKQVPCVHYQGVTLYYLSKIHAITQEDRLNKSLLKGADWLALRQKSSGRFDWGHSGLLFAYYLTGAYGFASAAFQYASKYDSRFSCHSDQCLSELMNLHRRPGLWCRWEDASWGTLPGSVADAVHTANLAKVGMKQSLFRLGYASYRQLARRRYKETVDDSIFKGVVSLLHLNVSTIESFANYPDLFMTTEILDCLSSTK